MAMKQRATFVPYRPKTIRNKGQRPECPVRSGDPHSLGRRIRALCEQYGISDRMPRPIAPCDKRVLNGRIVGVVATECSMKHRGMRPDEIAGKRIVRWCASFR
jgi:hypothetical protein